MQRIHIILIIIGTLGLGALVIWLLTRKPPKPKVGSLVIHPKLGIPVKVVKVHPVTKEPIIWEEAEPKPGKPPAIYK